jgi:hypothetical protein
MNKVSVIKDFVDQTEFAELLAIAQSTTESDWNLFNEESVNGPFWNGKRLMIGSSKTALLNKKIQDMWQSTDFTAANKVQRFSDGKDLGPLVDSEHANIKESLVIFLGSDTEDAGIEFAMDGIFIPATSNLAVVYDASMQYRIVAPKSSNPMYFITVFLNSTKQDLST